MFFYYFEQILYSSKIYWQALIVILAVFVSTHYSKYLYKTYLAGVLIYCSVVFGARTKSSGTDTESYSNYFNAVVLGADFTNEKIERGFYLLVKFISYFTDSSTVFLTTVYAVSLIFIFLSIGNSFRENLRPLVVATLISSFAYIDMSTNGIRQGIAVSIALYGVTLFYAFDRSDNYGKSQKKLSGLCLILLSGALHISTLLFFPFLFFKPTLLKLRVSLFLILVGFALLLLNYDISAAVIETTLQALETARVDVGGVNIAQKLGNIVDSDASVMEGVFRLIFFVNILLVMVLLVRRQNLTFGDNKQSRFALFYLSITIIYVFTVLLPFSYRYFYLTAYPGIFVTYLFLPSANCISGETAGKLSGSPGAIVLTLLYFLFNSITSYSTKAVTGIQSAIF